MQTISATLIIENIIYIHTYSIYICIVLELREYQVCAAYPPFLEHTLPRWLGILQFRHIQSIPTTIVSGPKSKISRHNWWKQIQTRCCLRRLKCSCGKKFWAYPACNIQFQHWIYQYNDIPHYIIYIVLEAACLETVPKTLSISSRTCVNSSLSAWKFTQKKKKLRSPRWLRDFDKKRIRQHLR